MLSSPSSSSLVSTSPRSFVLLPSFGDGVNRKFRRGEIGRRGGSK